MLARRRRIDLTETKPAVEETKPGGYQAGGGISLAPGGGQAVEPETAEPEPEPEPEPVVEGIAPPTRRLERLRGRVARAPAPLGPGRVRLLRAGGRGGRS